MKHRQVLLMLFSNVQMNAPCLSVNGPGAVPLLSVQMRMVPTALPGADPSAMMTLPRKMMLSARSPKP